MLYLHTIFNVGAYMFKTIKKIHQVEMRQVEIIKESQSAAAEILATAEKEADDLLKETNVRTIKETSAIFSRKEEEKESLISALRQMERKKIEALINQARQNFPQALDLILRDI